MEKYIPNISGFTDFCCYHENGAPICFVNEKLYASFDMLVSINTKYNFLYATTQSEIETAISNNLYMFDVQKTNRFYYPNDNMFSHSNEQKNIDGMILTLKKKYRTNIQRKTENTFTTPDGIQLLKEWIDYPRQIRIAEASAQALQDLRVLEFIHGRRERRAVVSFGLPYTSSGAFAGIWNTNAEARKRNTLLYFDGVALDINNKPVAIYTERNENGDEIGTRYEYILSM